MLGVAHETASRPYASNTSVELPSAPVPPGPNADRARATHPVPDALAGQLPASASTSAATPAADPSGVLVEPGGGTAAVE